MTSKGDQSTLGISGLRRVLRGIPTNRNEHLIPPYLPQEFVRVLSVVVVVIHTIDTRFDDVEVSEVGEPLFDLRDEVGEGRFRVLHPHPLERTPRGHTEPYSVFANGVADGFNDFQREPGTVLNRSTVLVGPFVRDVLEKLIRKVSAGEEE